MNRAKRRLFQLLTLAGSIVVLELGAAGVSVLLWHWGWMTRLQPVTPVMLADYLAHRNLPLDAFRTRPRREFPYLLALARWGAADFHVRAFIGGLPRHVPFYQADHPSRALALTSTILRTFASDATARGQRALVLLIPVGPDFAYHQRTGTWPDEPLY